MSSMISGPQYHPGKWTWRWMIIWSVLVLLLMALQLLRTGSL